MSVDKKDLEPDVAADAADQSGDVADPARRRPRRAGLRVPSDDVPRPQAARADASGGGEVEVDIDMADDTRPSSADGVVAAPSGAASTEELGADDLEEEEPTPAPANGHAPAPTASFTQAPEPAAPTPAPASSSQPNVVAPAAVTAPAAASAPAAAPAPAPTFATPTPAPAPVVATPPRAVTPIPVPPHARTPTPIAGVPITASTHPAPAVSATPHGQAGAALNAAAEAAAHAGRASFPPGTLTSRAVAAVANASQPAPAAAPPTTVEDAAPVEEGEEISSMELEEVDSSPAAAKPQAAKPQAAQQASSHSEPGKKKRRGKSWFEEIFDEDYLRTLPFLTPQATQREAAFVTESLGLSAGAHLLDVGCGYGRHAMELAARGYRVSGLDLSLPLLIRGADEAQRRGLSINFVHGDMRELAFDAQFDGGYCLFSTFGYFDDEANKKVAANIARALKPGARFLIEILNRDYIIADLPTRVWWEGDGCVVLEEVDFNYYTSRVVTNRSVVFEDGRQLEQEISVRTYALHELGKLLHGVGFRVLEVSGSIATRGRYFGKDSRQLLVLAERRADLPAGG